MTCVKFLWPFLPPEWAACPEQPADQFSWRARRRGGQEAANFKPQLKNIFSESRKIWCDTVCVWHLSMDSLKIQHCLNSFVWCLILKKQPSSVGWSNLICVLDPKKYYTWNFRLCLKNAHTCAKILIICTHKHILGNREAIVQKIPFFYEILS